MPLWICICAYVRIYVVLICAKGREIASNSVAQKCSFGYNGLQVLLPICASFFSLFPFHHRIVQFLVRNWFGYNVILYIRTTRNSAAKTANSYDNNNWVQIIRFLSRSETLDAFQCMESGKPKVICMYSFWAPYRTRALCSEHGNSACSPHTHKPNHKFVSRAYVCCVHEKRAFVRSFKWKRMRFKGVTLNFWLPPFFLSIPPAMLRKFDFSFHSLLYQEAGATTFVS